RATRVANIPGVTRNIQWVKISRKLELLDLPGILDYGLFKKGNLLKLINTMKDEDNDPEVEVESLCRELTKSELSHILPGFNQAQGDVSQFLSGYALQLNFLASQGTPDIRRAANHLIRKFQTGGFGPVTIERTGDN
ncbi:50S ribosome-binding GTPase, partial [bacterium]|nr:50S ribosome-binding GTPase [bacterium]